MTRRRAIALHEATHTVTAQKLGLTVTWTSIDSGHFEGQFFTAATHIPDESLDLDRDRLAVLVSMAAPSFISTLDKDVDAYARAEEQMAYKLASLHGLDRGDIYDAASDLTDEHREEIFDLARRLEDEGRIVFETV